MSSDFRAQQLQTKQIIASGTLGNGSGAKLVIYPIEASGNPINLTGSIDQTAFNTGSLNGQDIFLFVSGGIGEKGTNSRSITVFGGDVHISGSLSSDGGGVQQWVEGSPSPRLRTTASVAIGSDAVFAEDVSGSVFFYVSGSRYDNLDSARFDGTVIFNSHLVQNSETAGYENYIDSTSAGAIIASSRGYISASYQSSIISSDNSTISPNNWAVSIMNSVNSIIAGSDYGTGAELSSIIAAYNCKISSSLAAQYANTCFVAGSDTSWIDGGYSNTILATYQGYIGDNNDYFTPGNNSNYNLLAGGESNLIEGGTQHAAIIASTNSKITSSVHTLGGKSAIVASAAEIHEGSFNLLAASFFSFIKNANVSVLIGGVLNKISGATVDASIPTADAIIGGRENIILGDEVENIIIGGGSNTISSSLDSGIVSSVSSSVTSSTAAILLGGLNNHISTSYYSSILGGQNHDIVDSYDSIILGGTLNTISSSIDSNILNGNSNAILNSTNVTVIGTGISASNKDKHIYLGGTDYTTIVSGGLTGSLQRTITGHSFIIGGANITVNTNSLGQIEITGSGGSGTVQWVESATSPRLRTTASVAIGGTSTFAQDVGTNVMFYVSGSRYNQVSASVFGGDVIVSGSIINGSTQYGGIINVNSTAGNIIGSSNTMISGSSYSTIIANVRSGITGASNSFIGGGFQNNISALGWSGIVGGELQTISSAYDSFIGGGYSNQIRKAHGSTIVGGFGNTLTSTLTSGDYLYSTIQAALNANVIQTFYGGVFGGNANSVRYGHSDAIIAGYNNTITGGLNNSAAQGNVIVGGRSNQILNDQYLTYTSTDNFIAAANNCSIKDIDDNAIIASQNSRVYPNALYPFAQGTNFLAGTNGSEVSGANNSVVLGGYQAGINGYPVNLISRFSDLGMNKGQDTIIGGVLNYITGGFATTILNGVKNYVNNAQHLTVIGGLNNNLTDMTSSIVIGNSITASNKDSQIYLGGPSETINFGGGFVYSGVYIATASYTLAQNNFVIGVSASAVTTMSLPTSPETGRAYKIKDIKGNANTFNICISTSVGTIDGNATYTLSTNYKSVEVIYYGNNIWGTNQ